MTTLTGAPPARAASLRVAVRSPEMAFVAVMAVVAGALSLRFRLPFVWPNAEALRFLSIHYLIPIVALVAASALALRKRGAGGEYLALGFVAYTAILLIHFNIKLWAPFINPHSFDQAYYGVDKAFMPLVEVCFLIRSWIGDIVPLPSEFYLYAFIGMFYVSFIAHAVREPLVFRKVLFATMLVHGLGALGYLAAPAVGPFLYQPGVNPAISHTQAYMLSVRHDLLANGRDWLQANGARVFLAPLAAMPSLHAAASWVFVRFAARYERRLLVLYVPLLAFILIAAIANRYHYLIDILMGLLLAETCVALAERVFRTHRRQDGHPVPAPAPSKANPAWSRP